MIHFERKRGERKRKKVRKKEERKRKKERVSRNSGKRESLMRFIAWVKGLANER